jgi:threonine dehydratase
MRTQSVGTLNFEIILNHVDDIITVTDGQVIDTMKFLLERMKIVAEPTGAVAPAAVLFKKLNISGKKVCAIISGGNVSLKKLGEYLNR